MSLLLFVVISNIWILVSTHGQVYDKISDLPKAKVAVVLGTSKTLVNGSPNRYFKYRIEKAAELYKMKKVSHFILSGDNHSKYYNEPQDMKNALIAKGVPEDAITLDYAGFRTLDSMVRAKEIFGQEEVIVITQKFHAFRAIFIGEYHGISTMALTARDLSLEQSLKVEGREILARTKAVIDLYVLNESPKFLGRPETITQR